MKKGVNGFELRFLAKAQNKLIENEAINFPHCLVLCSTFPRLTSNFQELHQILFT